jgi:hypothetical protein
MAKRAAVIFTVLAIVLVQWLAADTQSPPELFMIGAPAVNQPRMAAPQMMAEWDYDVVLNEGDAQRRVIERLFRKAPPSALAAPSEDLALQMAAKEVIDIARSFGSAEGHFADKWVSRVMATEDQDAARNSRRVLHRHEVWHERARLPGLGQSPPALPHAPRAPHRHG